MLLTKFVRYSFLAVCAILALAASAEAQNQSAPAIAGSISLVMSDAASSSPLATNFDATGPINVLSEGGNPYSVALQAAGAGSTTYSWVSDPILNGTGAPVTFVGQKEVRFTISPGSGPAAVAQGDVTFTLSYGYFPTAGLHEHDVATGPAIARPDLPPPANTVTGTTGVALPAGPLPTVANLTFDFDASNVPLFPQGNSIGLILTVTTAGTADFTFTTDGFPTLDYILGAPGDSDLDGDGIPDPYDDDADGDGFTAAQELAAGTSDLDAAANPGMDADGDGFTLQQEIDGGTSDNDPDSFPGAGGFPWLLIVLVLIVVILLAGGGFLVVTVVGRKLKVTASHDGFQAIDQGQSAEYEITVVATGKKEEMVPVELSLKGVPEDWTATLEPAQLTLYSGEDAEPQIAILRLTPPAEEQYEAEAQVTVTATPTDEEGNTSALNPGSAAKTKTIVNIGMTDPEGGKKKRAKKSKGDDAEADGDAEDADANDEDATGVAAAAAATEAPAESSKPQIGMGKMSHDPADFSEGDTVTTTVKVRNKGDEEVSGLNLNLFVNDEKVDTKSVTLGGGDSVDVTFTWTAQADENRVRIKGGMKGA